MPSPCELEDSIFFLLNVFKTDAGTASPNSYEPSSLLNFCASNLFALINFRLLETTLSESESDPQFSTAYILRAPQSQMKKKTHDFAFVHICCDANFCLV